MMYNIIYYFKFVNESYLPLLSKGRRCVSEDKIRRIVLNITLQESNIPAIIP